VGARSEIYRRLKDLAKQGLTIIFYSTDLEEVGQLADRVVNFFRGNIVTSKPASRTSAREILYEILHGKEIPPSDQGEDKHVSS
jgi:ABC-type sugar transport system ATPase subunit